MDDGLFIDKEGLARLPLLDRANIKGGLKYDDYLSISQITDLICPVYAMPKDEEKKRLWRESRRMMQASKASYQREIINACKEGLIVFEGNIEGWTESEGENKYPLVKPKTPLKPRRRVIPFIHNDSDWLSYDGDWLPPHNSHQTYQPTIYYPADCTIHRDEFKRYWQLPNGTPHPINDLLVNWFGISLTKQTDENQPIKCMTTGLGRLINQNTEVSEALPIEQWAKIAVVWPDELSIKEIAKLAFPDDKELQKALIETLVKLCKDKQLNYYGDIDGWHYEEGKPNLYPKVKYESSNGGFMDLDSGYSLSLFGSDACLIHRDDFKTFLKSQNQWPVDGLLANWWRTQDDEKQFTTTAKNEKSQGKRDRQVTYIVQIAKQLGFDDLLNIPEGGKAGIKTECLKNIGLFTDDGFKKAWIEANKRGLICIENKEKYLSNQ